MSDNGAIGNQQTYNHLDIGFQQTSDNGAIYRLPTSLEQFLIGTHV